MSVKAIAREIAESAYNLAVHDGVSGMNALAERLISAECARVAKEALELIDVVDGSGSTMLNREPYKAKYAELKAMAGGGT